MDEPQKEKRVTARKVILVSFLVDLLDVALSTAVGILSGSIIMFTQVLEGLADLSSSGFLLIGVHRSSQKEDRTHPFGYGREIYIWTLLSALIMFGITATFSFYFGYQRFIHPEIIHNSLLAIAILIITFFTNFYAFYLSFRRLLKNRNAKSIIRIFYRSSLVETKTTFILDLMGTTASLLGFISLLIYQLTGDGRFDGLGAMVIGVVLAILAVFLLMGIMDLIIGKSASQETELKIRTAALSVDEVNGVLGLKTMHLGSEKLLVNLDVNMKNELDTDRLEKLMDEIKEKIRLVVPSAKYIQVELETPKK